MPGFIFAQEVNAPPGRVFAIATDIPRITEVIAAITKVELLTDGPTRVGTRWRETRKAGPGSMTVELEVTRLEKDQLVTIDGVMAGTRYSTTFSFEPIAAGTRVTIECKVTAETFLAEVMMPLTLLMLPTMSKDMQGDLRALKAAAERAP